LADADFVSDVIQRFFDFGELRFGQDADFLQHCAMSERAEDVLFPQPPIERDGLAELRDVGRWARGKTGAARNWRWLVHFSESLWEFGKAKSRPKRLHQRFPEMPFREEPDCRRASFV